MDGCACVCVCVCACGGGVCVEHRKGRERKEACGCYPTLPGEQPPWGRHEPPACGKVFAGLGTGMGQLLLSSQAKQPPDSAPTYRDSGKGAYKNGKHRQRANIVSSRAKVTGFKS